MYIDYIANYSMFNSWKEWTCVFFVGNCEFYPLNPLVFCGTPPGHHSRSSMAMFRGPLGGSPKLSMAGDPFALEGRLWTCSPWIIVMVYILYSNRVIMVIGLTLDAVGFCWIGENIIVRSFYQFWLEPSCCLNPLFFQGMIFHWIYHDVYVWS